ncbi:hypothetical protein Dsin_003702 [Dipteronia sinensis]|uniref:AIG1-type G domain-containing protein n=1 Tax=Dipteronia sinensis TaxID=43782 RepID=A0AAE0B825_9ROSI|nr:hypothetical protein Dsin_003702 [Dipteronia sinensis]
MDGERVTTEETGITFDEHGESEGEHKVLLRRIEALERKQGCGNLLIGSSGSPFTASIRQNILNLCQNRRVLFDNKTNDKTKKAEQVRELLSVVNMVIAQNGGQPYTHDWFTELKRLRLSHQKEFESLEGKKKMEILELKENMERSYDDKLKRITEMVELKLTQTTTRLQQQLVEEQAARLKVEKNLASAQSKTAALDEKKADKSRCAIL